MDGPSDYQTVARGCGLIKNTTSTTPFALIAALLLAGCSEDTTLQVLGATTFQGEPIPNGEIRFTPNSEQGNRGPAVFAMIKDDCYQTSREKDVQSGSYVLQVTGYGSAPTSNDPTAPNFGRPVFPAQPLFVELP